ncbi:hypothetical protein NLJ89_g6941 [Agrocybe chaxingu]|uniref:Carboxylesterase type B domain-containing protein n=1 Tax=Agrocybe chaxingu TaxID=84603 RepID=A0A9W8JYA5_9AGAR|nr:hypothetical protein NLJ89_g6941 [Agrocybe chaxingu]
MSPSPAVLLFVSLALSVHAVEPIVNLDYGRFQGKTTANVAEFLGVPFAAPPLGDLRFAAPQVPLPFDGVRQAVSYGPGCPYILSESSPFPGGGGPPGTVAPAIPQSEDCLSLNVAKPASITNGRKLPVLVWFYGGAFQLGETSQYHGGPNIIERSLALGVPIIYVSVNYRINAFGFLGGKEAKYARATNAGLKDLLWGESAGALSIGFHYLLNDGNPGGLFQGGFMQSGSPIILPEAELRQPSFDQLVRETNCTSSTDKLACLRAAPFDSLMAAIRTVPTLFSFESLELSFQPVIDGYYIARDPLISLQQGKYARLPFITGDTEDEGTIFSFGVLNITTNEQFLDFVHTRYLDKASPESIAALAEAYPDDVTKGSPFNTGTDNAVSPQFKRFSALHGDFAFQAPRRFFSRIAAKTQPVFGYRFIRAAEPLLGYYHSGDIAEFFGLANNTDFTGTDSLIYFTNYLNPNAPPGSISALRNFRWPVWNPWSPSPALFTFVEGTPSVTITEDTFRQAEMELLTNLTLAQVGQGI